MKSIRKYLFVMMAVAAVFGFVACGDDEDDRESVVYVDKNGYNAFTFYDDDSFVLRNEYADMELYSGTYSEGTSYNSIVLNVTKVNGTPVSYSTKMTATLSSDGERLTFNGTTYYLR